MYQLLASIVLGVVSALAAAESIPIVGNTPAEPTYTDENEYGYPYEIASSWVTTLPTTPTAISSYDTIVDPSIYSAPDIVSPSAETTLAGYPYTFLTVTESVDPLSTGAGSPYTVIPDPTSLDTSSTEEAAYTYSFPPFISPTSVVITLSTGGSSESTAVPLSTGASSGTSLAPYGTETLGPYTNSSTAEPTQLSSYGNPFTSGNSGISTSPTNIIESTTYVTVSTTSTLTSTLPSVNGSSVDPTAPISPTYATYPAIGLPSGTGTLGGITANSTSTSGVYPSKEPTYPLPSNWSSIIGTSPASGSSSLVGPVSTGTGGLSSYTGLPPYPTPSNASSIIGSSPASGLSTGTGSPSSGTGVSSTGFTPYPVPGNASSIFGTSPTGGSSSLIGPLPTGTGISSAPSAGTVGSTISLSTYGSVIWSNSTSTSLAGPTAISSSYPTAPIYPTYGTIVWSNSTSTSLAGPTAISSSYPTAPPYPTSGLSATEASSPIDTTCTETLTSTRSDGGDGTTSDFLTTFVTTVSPSIYPSVSFNSTTEGSPLTASSPSLSTIPILTTAPVVVTSADPVYTYPSVSVPVPTEYYHHHRRPHGGKDRDYYWPFGSGDEEKGERDEEYGYGYDDGEDYDFGDGGHYK